MPVKKIAKELAWIVGTALVVAFCANALHPRGIALIGEWDTALGVVSARSKQDVVDRRIEIDDVETAKKLYDAGAVFVDARPAGVFAAGRIRGARSLPAYEMEEHMESFLENVPPDAPLVTYCSGRTCEDSHFLAEWLKEMGYTRVQVFVDGYPAWTAAGYPVES